MTSIDACAELTRRGFAASLLAASFCAGMPVAAAPRDDLPDPLTLLDGSRVRSHRAWFDKRAPELRRLFQANIYGQLPPRPVGWSTRLLYQDRKAFDGRGTLREIEVIARDPALRLRLLLATPTGVERPPCFIGLNFPGNHAVVADPNIRIPEGWLYNRREDGSMSARGGGPGSAHLDQNRFRGTARSSWPIEECLARGYAVATAYNGEIVPDHPELAEVRLAELSRRFDGVDRSSRAGAIAAWSWGLMRMVDALADGRFVDPKRLVLFGHSRHGKAALLAGAFDTRPAIIIPHQAGGSGTAPARVPSRLATPGPDGRAEVETIAAVLRLFPYWFCDRYRSFAADPSRLPVDQHELIALCAPTPVLVTNATEDRWAYPEGQFDMLQAADPVYRLVAGRGLAMTRMPAEGELLASRLGYAIRTGEHSTTVDDWRLWLRYADRWLPRPR